LPILLVFYCSLYQTCKLLSLSQTFFHRHCCFFFANINLPLLQVYCPMIICVKIKGLEYGTTQMWNIIVIFFLSIISKEIITQLYIKYEISKEKTTCSWNHKNKIYFFLEHKYFYIFPHTFYIWIWNSFWALQYQEISCLNPFLTNFKIMGPNQRDSLPHGDLSLLNQWEYFPPTHLL
jgi:hypothetical protein